MGPWVSRRRSNTYPLSMTRAATSSILIEERELAVVLVVCKVASGAEGPLCLGPGW